MPKIMKNGTTYGSSPSRLEGLDDVNITNPQVNQVLVRNSSNTAWINKNVCDWNVLLNEALTNADETFSINYGTPEPSEIMFLLMNTTNSRIISTTVIPFGTFRQGAGYVFGASNLAGTELYSAVFIWVDSTHIEIARASNVTNLRARVFVR